MRTYTNQFDLDLYPCYIPHFILSNCVDRSWGNETCPHFENEELMLCFWIDFDNPTHRELESPKYTVVEVLNFEADTLAEKILLETDNEEELITFCREYQLHKAMDRAAFELAAVLEGLYKLPADDFRNYRISLVENCIDDFNEACSITEV